MDKPGKSAVAVVGLRSIRGYSATKHDGNMAEVIKTLRRHFGQVYDRNSAGNN